MNEIVGEEMRGEDELKARIRELEEENENLRKLSTLDETTGLFLTQKIGREVILNQIERAHYEGNSVGLARIDVNKLKEFNKKLGHEATDKLLARVGEEIGNWALTRNGVGMRFHGDELGVLIPCRDIREIEELMKSFKGVNVSDLTNEELKVSWTVGCAHEKEPEVQKATSELDHEGSKPLEEAGRLFTTLCEIADKRERMQKVERT
jgi:diguanylate cyclase (GGDEF)-like protein